MDQALKQKIEELLAEADRQGQWPAVAVLHMLLGAYNTGEQKKFAKHAMTYSAIRFSGDAQATDAPSDFLDAWRHNEYTH